MIKRRNFMLSTLFLGLAKYTYASKSNVLLEEFEDVRPILNAVLKHMFPPHSLLPSAKETKLIDFVYVTITHTSYDKDIRSFVVEGAKVLKEKEVKDFVSLTCKEKEHALRRYEKSSYGSAWLSRIIILGMEGMLSDPIYGANIKGVGWRALFTHGGLPRPQGRYLEDV